MLWYRTMSFPHWACKTIMSQNHMDSQCLVITSIPKQITFCQIDPIPWGPILQVVSQFASILQSCVWLAVATIPLSLTKGWVEGSYRHSLLSVAAMGIALGVSRIQIGILLLCSDWLPGVWGGGGRSGAIFWKQSPTIRPILITCTNCRATLSEYGPRAQSISTIYMLLLLQWVLHTWCILQIYRFQF
jgi:hypothetical protein